VDLANPRSALDSAVGLSGAAWGDLPHCGCWDGWRLASSCEFFDGVGNGVMKRGLTVMKSGIIDGKLLEIEGCTGSTM
jgi:hypothetical protein